MQVAPLQCQEGTTSLWLALPKRRSRSAAATACSSAPRVRSLSSESTACVRRSVLSCAPFCFIARTSARSRTCVWTFSGGGGVSLFGGGGGGGGGGSCGGGDCGGGGGGCGGGGGGGATPTGVTVEEGKEGEARGRGGVVRSSRATAHTLGLSCDLSRGDMNKTAQETSPLSPKSL